MVTAGGDKAAIFHINISVIYKSNYNGDWNCDMGNQDDAVTWSQRAGERSLKLEELFGYLKDWNHNELYINKDRLISGLARLPLLPHLVFYWVGNTVYKAAGGKS